VGARTQALALAWLLALGACAPPACQDEGGPDRRLLHDVQLLVKDDGPIGRAAAERLKARGREAIPVIETGLYQAEPPARLRIVRLLRDIGTVETRPILTHLAKHDPDPQVRDAAGAGLP
jgi:hypothetical protein